MVPIASLLKHVRNNSGHKVVYSSTCIQRGTLIDAGCGDGEEGVLEDPSVLMGLAGFGQ